MSLNDCILLDFSQKIDPRGKLSIIENNKHIPFGIQRIFYIYDVPAGSERGGHAHREQEQVVIALSGSIDITLDDGVEKKQFTLNNPNQGLYIPSMIWDELNNFSADAVCLVLASAAYDENDYFRQYQEFLREKGV